MQSQIGLASNDHQPICPGVLPSLAATFWLRQKGIPRFTPVPARPRQNSSSCSSNTSGLMTPKVFTQQRQSFVKLNLISLHLVKLQVPYNSCHHFVCKSLSISIPRILTSKFLNFGSRLLNPFHVLSPRPFLMLILLIAGGMGWCCS